MAEEPRIAASVDRLRELFARFDPLVVLSECAIEANHRSPRDELGHEKHVAVEYLAGLALAAGEPGTTEPPLGIGRSTITDALQLIALEGELLVSGLLADQRPELLFEQLRLRAENLADRDQGYGRILERVIRRTVAPLRADALAQLGFDPADVPTVVSAVHRLSRQRFQSIGFDGPLAALGSTEEEVDASAELQDEVNVRWLRDAARRLYRYAPAEVAQEAALPTDEVAALLDALASRPGCQPGFRRPIQDNRFRRFPVIALADGRFWFPLTWKPLDEFVPWFLMLLRERRLADLERRFLRARDSATEAIAREALATVFGADLRYDRDGISGEIDGLVDADPVAIVVEAKAHRVRDPVRRGGIGDIAALNERLLTQPLAQLARSEAFLSTGGCDFAGPAGPYRLPGAPREIVSIVVSFERLDPLTLSAGELAGEAGAGRWVVPLTDLLVATETLDDPSCFFVYARRRTEIAADPSFVGSRESDFLGAFLQDRLLEPFDALAEPGASLDAYYGTAQLGARPHPEVPPILLGVLGAAFESRDPTWHVMARLVLGASPTAWASFDRLHEQARAAAARGGVARREITLRTGLRLILLASEGEQCFAALADLRAPAPWLAIAERVETYEVRHTACV